MKKNANTLTRRIYRNKMRIREHLIMACFGIIFLMYYIFIHGVDANLVLPLCLIVFAVILSDFMMIIWHRHWIKKWHEELSSITGIDYTVLDKNEELPSSLPRKKYDEFLNTLQNAEKKVIQKSLNGEEIKFVEKGIILSIDSKFKLWCENNAIIYPVKFHLIDPDSLIGSKKKKGKKKKKK